jgi:RNA polymerase sigma-70 factor, ECF subfamily
MSSETPFDGLMERLRAGDQDAAAQIFRRYGKRLIGLARNRLDPVLQQKTSPEDVLQSVFKSFFLRAADGQFEIGDWDSMWSLLTLLTVRKCARWADYYRAQRRDVRRETPLPTSGDGAPSWEALNREPTPAEAILLTETVERLLTELKDRDREMVVLSLQGETTSNIATAIGCADRTVERVLERVRKRLMQECQPAS